MKNDIRKGGATRMTTTETRGTDRGQERLLESMRVGEAEDIIGVRGQLIVATKDIPGVQGMVMNHIRRLLSETNQSHEKIIGEGQGHPGEEMKIQSIVDEVTEDRDHQEGETTGKKCVNDQAEVTRTKKQFVRQNLQPCNQMLLRWRKIEAKGWPRWRYGMLERKRRKIKGERRMVTVSSLHFKNRLLM